VIVPDVNMLLYAVVDGFPQHERARSWWEALINSNAHIGLSAPAVFGFLRISTSARVFTSPVPVEDAIDRVGDWLAQPAIELLTPGPGHLDIALGLLREIGTAGNLTTDVQLAAYAIEFKGEVHSADADFARFRDVVWVNPLR
jgi:toxin-antitoxin system PIN domain toxin